MFERGRLAFRAKYCNHENGKGLGFSPNPLPINKKAVPVPGRRLIGIVLASE